jgi:hypothetical protein
MSRTRAALALPALLTCQALVVAALHRLGAAGPIALPQDPVLWLRTGAPEDVVVAALRLVALGLAWWLLGSTALYTAARLAGWRGAVGLLGRALPTAVRRVADRAVALSVSATLALPALPAAAALAPPEIIVPPPPAATVGPAGDALGPVPAPGLPATAPSMEPGVEGGPAPSPRDGIHVVAPGEHLWSIAAQSLAAARGVPPATLPERDVAAHWVAVVAANEGALPSGDPDLVHPGDEVVLPPVER